MSAPQYIMQPMVQPYGQQMQPQIQYHQPQQMPQQHMQPAPVSSPMIAPVAQDDDRYEFTDSEASDRDSTKKIKKNQKKEAKKNKKAAKKAKKAKTVPPCKACCCCCFCALLLLLIVAVLIVFSVISTPPKMTQLDVELDVELDSNALTVEIPFGQFDIDYNGEAGSKPVLRSAFPFFGCELASGVYSCPFDGFVLTALSFMNPSEQNWLLTVPEDLTTILSLTIKQTSDLAELDVDASVDVGHTMSYSTLIFKKDHADSEITAENIGIVPVVETL
eukprot:gnl/Dysnectes_brevis/188_a217_4904.p1 GENE.gnl/Dysnectes_brevis/188_a217_4904~~gnl/Dysnectes_brevis/188_a217_4904.p1  ORF type:complete len:276 (+),score=102.88 gnl/Dysnectes_brevis/188_a217_4904:79-906(+)